jgi:hypothetical protein
VRFQVGASRLAPTLVLVTGLGFFSRPASAQDFGRNKLESPQVRRANRAADGRATRNNDVRPIGVGSPDLLSGVKMETPRRVKGSSLKRPPLDGNPAKSVFGLRGRSLEYPVPKDFKALLAKGAVAGSKCCGTT